MSIFIYMEDKVIRLDGQRVEELRRRKYRTQKDFVRVAGISLRTYTNIVQGEYPDVRLYTIGRLCDALNCAPQTIIDYEYIPEDAPSPS